MQYIEELHEARGYVFGDCEVTVLNIAAGPVEEELGGCGVRGDGTGFGWGTEGEEAGEDVGIAEGGGVG